MTTRLTEHFTLEELTETSHREFDNACPPALLPDLLKTAEMMERIRAALSEKANLDIPISVTSGYRSPAVNAAVGSGPGSDHLLAAAVDFKAPAFGTPYQVAQFLADKRDELGIGQVIHEYGRWVHVSTRTPAREVNEAITYAMVGGRKVVHVGIVEVA